MKLNVIPNRGIRAAFLAWAACVVSTPLAQAQDAPLTPSVPHGISEQSADEGTLIFNEEYYKQITYTWTDSQGVEHESNLAEPATEYEQIVAMLREVYMNPNVPGFLEDPVKYNHDGDKVPDDPNILNTVQYKPCLADGNPYGMKEDDVIPTPIEGATALIVELKEGYEYEKNVSAADMLRKVKEVHVLTNQLYIDTNSTNPDKPNPGYLFNFVGMLDKFFIITKGNLRIAKNAEEGHPPFYNMYEEFSPSNKEPIYHAYPDMAEGAKFAVDHNCTSILSQNHIIVMSPEGEDNEYPMNFMFYLPDRRFSGDTRTSGIPGTDNKLEYYGWYTYYGSENQPYFFFNDIDAIIPEKPVYDEAKKEAKVRVEWESTYNEVVGFRADEQFYVYRVINDVIQEDPIPYSEYEIEESYYNGYTVEISEDGALMTDKRRCVIYVNEEQDFLSRDVYYIVKGRRYPSEFELVESNIVNTRILGYGGVENLSINIDGRPKSKYNLQAQQNDYVNEIFVTDTPVDEDMMLRRKHIKPRNGNEKGTVFTLRRYHTDSKGNEDIGSAKDIAYMEIISEEVRGGGLYQATGLHQGWSVFVYKAQITYPDDPENKLGRETEIEFKSQNSYIKVTKDKDVNGKDIEVAEEIHFDIANQPIVAVDANVDKDTKIGTIARFKDIFSASTYYGDQPSSYHYYIMYESNVPIKDNGVTGAVDNVAYSNVVDVAVPVRALKVGYQPYTDDDIMYDNVHGQLLSLNNSGIQFETRGNPYLINYTVRNVSQGKDMVKVTRMPTGQLFIERLNPKNGKLETHKNVLHGKWANVPVELVCPVNDSDEFVLYITYSNGNTYGNKFQHHNPQPYPAFTNSKIVDMGESPTDPSKHRYLIQIEYDAYDLDSHTSNPDEMYQVHNYRLWGQLQYPDDDGNTEHELLSGFDGEYTAAPRRARAMSPQSVQVNTIEVDADPTGITEDNPILYNHHVRLYAKLPDTLDVNKVDKADSTVETHEDVPQGYILSDATHLMKITENGVITSLGVVPIDKNRPRYYDLSGCELDPQNLPSGVIIQVNTDGEVKKIVN